VANFSPEVFKVTGTAPEWFLDAIAQTATPAAVTVRGAQIQYRIWPSAAADTLVLVHGHGAHSHWWDFIAPALTEHYQVVAMDCSGAGDSDHRQEYTAGCFAEEIHGVLQATSGERNYLVGHSFGGTMSRIAAWQYPEEIDALILVDSALGSSKGRRQPPSAPRTRERFYPDLPTAMKRFRLRPPQPCENRYILEHIAEHSIKETDQGFCFKLDQAVFAKMTQDVEYPDAISMIQEIQARLPVALIYGDQSRFFPPEMITGLNQLIDERLLFAVADAYHHVFLDQPLAFVDQLKACLAKLAEAKMA